tara:strand:- start:1051 stop:3663 length:2613 start_codon:yes stop_codon:yes gene_type:complete
MTPAADDPVEAIMAECLNRSESEWQSALASACARHPELADRLRARFESLQGYGLMLTDGHDSHMSGQIIGDYQVLGNLGSGASATVVRASHVSNGDVVALKLLRDHMDVTGRWRERFQREMRLAQDLEHEGLCRVLAWGEHESQPFLVMSLVEGQTLAAEIASQPLTATEVARRVSVLVQVAQALQYMHVRGLVHRDVKPDNILVRQDGSAVLTDLGLTFEEDEGHSLTASNVLPGSPAYFAPELVHGTSRGSISSDVYALGVILHECATGSLPFQGPTRAALFRQILAGKRQVMGGTAPLRRVASTAMARRPQDRYRSADEFAGDLARCLRGERPIAQGPGVWRSLTGWIVRNHVAAVIVLALALGGAVAAVAFVQTQDALTKTRAIAMTLAAKEAIHDNLDRAVRLAAVVHRQQPTAESRSLLYESLADRHAWRSIPEGDFAQTSATSLVVAANSATGMRVEVSSGEYSARVWHADGTLLDVVPHPCDVVSVALSVSGALLATGGGDGVVRLYELDARGSRFLTGLHGHRGVINKVAFAPAAHELFTRSDDGTARAWQTQPMLMRWRHPRGAARFKAVVVPAGLLLVGQDPGPNQNVVVVDASGATLSPPWLRAVPSILDSSNRYLLQCSEDDPGIVDLVQSKRWSWSLHGRAGRSVQWAAATKGGGQLFTVTGKQVDRWLLRAGTYEFDRQLATFEHDVSALAVSEDGARIICGSTRGDVWVLNAEGLQLADHQLHREHIWSIAVRSDGQQLLTASRDETAWCGSLNLRDGTVLTHGGTVLCADYSRDAGRVIATGCVDGVVRLWDQQGALLAALRGRQGQIEHLAFTVGGGYLISASKDGSVRRWPLDDETLLRLAATVPEDPLHR